MSSQFNSTESLTPNSFSSLAVERVQDSPVEEALRLWGVAGVALAVLLTGVMGFLSWRGAAKAAEDADWVAHTHAVMGRLETTLADTVDVETGARGFVVTDAEVFLEPYKAGQIAVRHDLETLRQQVADNPGQLQRLDRLELQINAGIEAARRKVTERRETGTIPAASVFLEGKRRMDMVLATVKEMESEEGRLLDQRSAEMQEARRRTKIITSASTLTGVVLLLLAGFRMGREIDNSARMRGQLGALNANLEQRVEQRKAALRESERKYRTLFDSMDEGFCTIEVLFDQNNKSVDYRFLEVNPAFEKQTGMANARGRSMREMVPELEEYWFELFGKVALTGEPARVENEAAELHRWFDVHGFRVGEPEKRKVAIVFSDITERKLREGELRESEERFQAMANGIPQLAWMAEPDGHIFWYNQRWYEYTGTTFEQMEGWGWQSVHDPGVLPKVLVGWNAAIAAGLPFDMEFPLRGGDGVFRAFLTRVMPFKDSEGRVTRWFGTNTDISERQRAEREIRRLNDELEQRVQQRTAQLQAANQELEAFTYSVSHDLRAPLRHIGGFSKILTEEFGPHLPADAQHHLQRIQEGARRMGLLVDDLLNLARVGRSDLTLRATGVKSVVEEVIAELAPECVNRQIEWKIGDLPLVQCDPGLIRQVFQNLLANAVKFTRPRTQAVVEIGQTDKDGSPVLFVRDNGVGFNMKYADKLFGVFQRLHRLEDFEGTGVGLATVQRIIQKHGGSIWPEAELDKGATFYFTLGLSEEVKTKAAVAGEKA